jgi:predicted nucleic acid-binding protein
VPALLDTGALELPVRQAQGSEPAVELRRRDRRVETLALRHYPPLICPHVAGEFLYGQFRAKVSAATLAEVRTFLGSFEMLGLSANTANIYALLRAAMSTKGITLPDPDYWIAAHALDDHLPLITTDHDFRHMPELLVYYISPEVE